MIQQIDRKDLVQGCVLGLAVGNALGVGVSEREESKEVSEELAGGGPYGLKPGEWMAETSMAMCLAESLLACEGFDGVDVMGRFCNWFEHGYWSCRDFCFGVEEPMRQALLAHKQGKPLGRGPRLLEYGGVLARTAPLALYYLHDAQATMLQAARCAQLTHPDPVCVDVSRYFALLVHGALQGVDKETLLAPDFAAEGLPWARSPLVPEVEALRQGDYLSKPSFTLEAPENLLSILQAALWAFGHGKHFKDGALKAVSLGGKSEVVGAVYGQLAGAYYGAQFMPDNWLRVLAHREALEELAERLWRATLLGA